jgi:hypothetical protein
LGRWGGGRLLNAVWKTGQVVSAPVKEARASAVRAVEVLEEEVGAAVVVVMVAMASLEGVDVCAVGGRIARCVWWRSETLKTTTEKDGHGEASTQDSLSCSCVVVCVAWWVG